MIPGPRFQSLVRLDAGARPIPAHTLIPSRDIPAPYHDLLVHADHMTVTVEAFYGSLVDVRVLNRLRAGDLYSRQSLLHLQSTGQVVQFGAVRIHLDDCTPAVRDAILLEQIPLGRILIEHDILRRIELTDFVRLRADADFQTWFALSGPADLFGRLGTIHCDDHPAIELLEILAPVPGGEPTG